MGEQRATACDKCGLQAVRHELERQGTMLRFCDSCYWGEIDGTGGGDGLRTPKTEQASKGG